MRASELAGPHTRQTQRVRGAGCSAWLVFLWSPRPLQRSVPYILAEELERHFQAPCDCSGRVGVEESCTGLLPSGS